MFINNNSTCYFQKVILSFCKPRMRVGQGETGGPVYLTDWQGAHSVARSPVIQQCAAPKMAAAAKAVKMSKFRPTMDQAKVTNTYFIIFCGFAGIPNVENHWYVKDFSMGEWDSNLCLNCQDNKQYFYSSTQLGNPPGLVVHVEDSRSEPWSSDVGSNPGFT